jgi:hypothetical protein
VAQENWADILGLRGVGGMAARSLRSLLKNPETGWVLTKDWLDALMLEDR